MFLADNLDSGILAAVAICGIGIKKILLGNMCIELLLSLKKCAKYFWWF